jgi:tetratricopeptide (TPR) repeat protein
VVDGPVAEQAAHRLAGDFPDGSSSCRCTPTPGQQPVDPADALASLLLTAGISASQIPPGLEARAARWRGHVADKKILLVLDDAAGHEHVRPLLPGTPGSLVLITSRRLSALEDAAVVSLDTLTPAEAAGLLARLAGRADVTADDPGVGELAAVCGYLPLAIGMTGRQLAHHPAWAPAGLAHELAVARDRVELMHAENLSVAAAFGLSYRDLDDGQRRLFRRLGLHPGPDIDAYAAAALDGSDVAAARRRLEALYDQHLIAEPVRGRYRFHALIREHARTLAAADDPAARDAAATRLLDYYLHTARAASGHISSFTDADDPAPPGRPPGSAPPVSTPEQAAGWLEAERANLHAAAGYAAATARPSYVMSIPAAMTGFLGTRGHWDQALVLHQAALAAARGAGDRPGQAGALMLLSPMQLMTDDIPAAIASATEAPGLYRDLGDRTGQAAALDQIGFLHQMAADYPAAAAELRQALELFRGLGDRRGQGDALTYLGEVHCDTGDYRSAAACLGEALELQRDTGYRWGQSRALMSLGTVQQLTGDYPAAAASHQRALDLNRDFGRRLGQAETLNCLGELSSRIADGRQARDYHARALAIARELGTAPEEARVLEGIGHSHLHDGHASEGTAHLEQALAIYQRIGAPAGRRVQETLLRSRPGGLTPGREGG